MTASRRELALAGAAAALALAGPATAGAASDADQLERLLSFEQRLASAYRAALERDAIDHGLGATLLAHEREHVRGLEQALRGAGRRRPLASVPSPDLELALESRRAFARFALGLEADAVTAYQAALATLGNRGLLQPLGSIMACGAQHEVALRQSLGSGLLGE